ncbi:MAG: hypothetical protein ABL933_11410 [Methyloglobulus sp.]
MLSKNIYTSIALLLWTLGTVAYGGITTRVSVDSNGLQQNYPFSRISDISADGRFVAFDSYSTNLVPGDTNGTSDIFVHDSVTGQTKRISVSGGLEGNSNSSEPDISADGRFVAYASDSSNLVPGDTNGGNDVFVYDRVTGLNTRVSVDSNGREGNYNKGDLCEPKCAKISADGRFVVFSSESTNLVLGDTNNKKDIFVHDRATRITTRVSVNSSGLQGNGHSHFSSSLSVDGRFVAFSSESTDLVPGDTNNSADIFVHDRVSGQTTRVSVNSRGVEGKGSSIWPSLSADGRFVAFTSSSANLVVGDTNNRNDVFVHDRSTGQTSRVSVNSSGLQGNWGGDLSDISADGRFVAFDSFSTNLDPSVVTFGGPDVFVHDRVTGQTRYVSVNFKGKLYAQSGFVGSISADGRFVTFGSGSANLVPGDTNLGADTFVRDRLVDPRYHADASIAVTQKPASLRLNTEGDFIYTVTNKGTEAATTLKLTHLVSAGSVTKFTASQGSCKSYATVSLCNLGTLLPDTSLTLQTRVKAIGKSLSQQVSVNGVKVDDVPTNNKVTVKTWVTP